MALGTLGPQSEEEKLNDHGDPIVTPQFGPGSPLKDLEEQFAAPSIADSDRNNEVTRLNKNLDEPSYGKKSADAIASQEETSGSERAGFWKNDEGKESFTRIRRGLRFTRKKTATGLVIGAIGLGGFGFFSFIQGPLQLVHLSQILQKPFGQQEKDSESRLKGLLRFARSGDFGETRVGYFGSRSAIKTEDKLKKMGVTFVDKDPGGFPREVRIDLVDYERETGKKFNAEKYATDAKLPLNQVNVDTAGKYVTVRDPSGKVLKASVFRSATKPLVGTLFEGKRFGKVTTSVKARPVLNKNGAYSKLHPWKRLEAASLKKAAEIDAKRQAKKKQRSEKAQKRFDNLKKKVSPKTAAAGAGAATLQLGVCLVRDVAHEVPLVNHESTNIPARNDALEKISWGEQTKSNYDFNESQPGQAVKGLTDSKGNSVWQSKALDALANGGEGKGTDFDQETKNNFSHNSPEADVEKALETYGGANHLCSPAGIIIGAGIGIVSIALAAPTGGASLVTYAAFQAGTAAATMGILAVVTQQAINALKDEPLPERFTSAPFQGSVDAFGSVDLAGDFYRKSGGAPLDERATADTVTVDAEGDEEFKRRSFFARTFDVYDYRTLASRTIDKINPSVEANLNSLASTATKPWSLFSGFAGMFDRKAQAAEKAYDFGIPKYGFKQSELTNDIFEDPYDNANKAAAILDSDPSYIERAKKCFGVELSKGGNGWEVDLVDNPDGDPEKDVVPSTADYVSAKCAEGNDNWLRIRLFIFDSRTMEAYACYDNDEEACAAIGVTSGGSKGSADAVNPNIFVLGDSLTVGMRDLGELEDKLKEKDWVPTAIEATGSRTVSLALGEDIDKNKDNIKKSGTIVIALGTNKGTDFKSNAKKLIDKMRELSPDAQIFWMNAYGGKDNYKQINDSIDELAAVENIEVIDWSKEYKGDSDKYPWGDAAQIHHDAKGYKNKSLFLLDSIGSPPAGDGGSVQGVECPTKLTSITVGGTKYYQMPGAPNGEYTFDGGTPSAQRYGKKELVCTIHTVAKAYKAKHGAKSTVKVGDLNASGHASHKWGVGVDINAKGQLAAADSLDGNYNKEATLDLGKMFIDTGKVKNIWWCGTDGSIQELLTYAQSKNKSISIQCLPNHEDHFHVDISAARGAEHTP